MNGRTVMAAGLLVGLALYFWVIAWAMGALGVSV